MWIFRKCSCTQIENRNSEVLLVVIAVFLSCCGNISYYSYVMCVKAVCVCAPALDGICVLKLGKQ